MKIQSNILWVALTIPFALIAMAVAIYLSVDPLYVLGVVPIVAALTRNVVKAQLRVYDINGKMEKRDGWTIVELNFFLVALGGTLTAGASAICVLLYFADTQIVGAKLMQFEHLLLLLYFAAQIVYAIWVFASIPVRMLAIAVTNRIMKGEPKNFVQVKHREMTHDAIADNIFIIPTAFVLIVSIMTRVPLGLVATYALILMLFVYKYALEEWVGVVIYRRWIFGFVFLVLLSFQWVATITGEQEILIMVSRISALFTYAQLGLCLLLGYMTYSVARSKAKAKQNPA